MFAGIKKRFKAVRAIDATASSSYSDFTYALSNKTTDSANARMVRLFKVLELGAQADDEMASLGFVCAVNNLERMHKANNFGAKFI